MGALAVFQALNTINKAQGSLPQWVLQAEELYFLSFFFFKIYLLLAVLALRCFVWALLELWRAGATLHWGADFSLRWLLARARAPDVRASVLVARELAVCGAPARLPGSTWDLPRWDQTHVPCVGRWVLTHWATREVVSL